MLSRSSSSRIVALALVLAVGFGFAVGRVFPPVPVVSAGPDDVPPTAPGTIYRTYPGFCFTPSGTEAGSTQSYGYAVHQISQNVGAPGLVCLLDLPQGAMVTEVIFYLRDDSPKEAFGSFRSDSPVSGVGEEIFGTVGTGTQDAREQVQLTLSGSPLAIVDNTRYSYLLEVNLREYNESSPTQIMYGARVGYVTSTTMLPLVQGGGS